MEAVQMAAGMITTEERTRNFDVAQVWNIRCPMDWQITPATRIAWTSDYIAVFACERCGGQHVGNTIYR